MESKDMLLSDAIETAIRAEKKILKLERAVAGLTCLNIVLLILFIFL